MQQRFYASRGKRHVVLQVCPRTRLFMLRGKLWDAEGLRALGFYESSDGQQLPKQELGPFGDAAGFQGTFSSNRYPKKGGRPAMHYGLKGE